MRPLCGAAWAGSLSRTAKSEESSTRAAGDDAVDFEVFRFNAGVGRHPPEPQQIAPEIGALLVFAALRLEDQDHLAIRCGVGRLPAHQDLDFAVDKPVLPHVAAVEMKFSKFDWHGWQQDIDIGAERRKPA